jgi:hypothetical protein
MPKVAIVIPYFGRLPALATYFFESVGHARNIDVLFFTDVLMPAPAPRNVKVYTFSLAQFSELASRALGIQVHVVSPYKLCDFKPAYGVVFSEYLRDYEFWGFGDIDLICGRLDGFLEPLLAHHDLVSCRKGWISGSLCVMRNCPEINSAYACSSDWSRAFALPNCQHFDEMGGHFYQAVLAGADLRTLKGKVDSFTHVVRRLQSSGKLRCAFENLACEDLDWGETLLYDSGRITRCRDGADVMYVHTVLMKRRFFHVPSPGRSPQRFYIRKSGIYTKRQYSSMRHVREAARVLWGGASCLSRRISRWVG